MKTINCNEFDEHLADSFDQTATKTVSDELQAHRASCARCQEKWESAQVAVRALQRHPDVVTRMAMDVKADLLSQKTRIQAEQPKLKNVRRWAPRRKQELAHLIESKAAAFTEFEDLEPEDSTDSILTTGVLDTNSQLSDAVSLSVIEPVRFTQEGHLVLKLQAPQTFAGHAARIYLDLLGSGRFEIGEFKVGKGGEINILSDLSVLSLNSDVLIPLNMIEVVLAPSIGSALAARFVVQLVQKASGDIEWKPKLPQMWKAESQRTPHLSSAHRLAESAPPSDDREATFYYTRLSTVEIGVSYLPNQNKTINIWIRALHLSSEREPMVGERVRWFSSLGEGPSDVTNSQGEAEFPNLGVGKHTFQVEGKGEDRLEIEIKA